MTNLGKYELYEQLGRGGFGTVYRATDDIGRVVAVKVLKPGFADDQDVIERFRREAMAAGSLFHQHIATILDFGESDGRLFIAMRYVDGQPLDKIIKERGKLPWDEAVEIVTQVGDALDFAHKKGFIHRDIKPGNILISPSEGAVLTDFGLVKAVTTSGMSTTGVMLGTPAYIAPEIWSGKEATPATDVYSLACVFYEMVTGKVLFDGDSTPEIMKKHFDPIEICTDEIPEAVREVLSTALSKNGKDRYQRTNVFLSELFTTTLFENELKDWTHELEGPELIPEKNVKAEVPGQNERLIDQEPITEAEVVFDLDQLVIEADEEIQEERITGTEIKIKAIFSKRMPTWVLQLLGMFFIIAGLYFGLTNRGLSLSHVIEFLLIFVFIGSGILLLINMSIKKHSS